MGAAALSAGQHGEPLAGGSVVTYPTPAGLSAEAYAAALRATGRFAYVSPDYVLSVSDYTATPDDPDFSDLLASLTGSPAIRLRKGALALLDVGRPLAAGSAELRWLVPPDLLRR